MNVPRRAAARIAVVAPAASEGAARALLRAELNDVTFLTLDAATPDAVPEVDMLLFVVDAADDLDATQAGRLAERARAGGLLVAAIVFDAERRAGPSAALASVREAADMVMVVRDAADVQAVVAALR